MQRGVWSIVLAVILLAGVGFAAPAAAAEEVLRITCWAGYAKPYAENFKKLVKEKFGVDLKVEIFNPTDQDEFYAAAKNGTADLISPPYELPKMPKFYAYGEGGFLVQAVDVNNIPNLKKMLPVFREDPTPLFDGKRYGVPYNCGPYGLAYNSDVVKQAPDSWNVLWDPQYAGKYTVNNNFPKVNVWISALALGYTYADLFDIAKLDRGKIQPKLDALATNAKSLWDGSANPDEFPQLSLATDWGFAAAQANLKGGHWRIATPKEGGTAWIDAWYITKAATGMKKRLAEEWINFMLAEENQADIIPSQGVSPVIDVSARLNPEQTQMFHVGDNDYFKTVALWRVMSEETEKAFDEMWSKAKSKRK